MTTGLTDAFNRATLKPFAPAEAAPEIKREEFRYIFNGTEATVVGGRPITPPESAISEITPPETPRRVSNLHDVLGMPRIPRRTHG